MSPSATALCSDLLAPSSSIPATLSRAPARTTDKARFRSRHAPTDTAVTRESRDPKASSPAAESCGCDSYAVFSGRVTEYLASTPALTAKFLPAENG